MKRILSFLLLFFLVAANAFAGPFEDFVNDELPRRASVTELPPGGNFPAGKTLFTTGIGLGVEVADIVAENIGYDNAASGLVADDVQAAIDELDVAIDGVIAGAGDVSGPVASTDNAIVRWDGITGNLIQDSANGPFVSDAGSIDINGGISGGYIHVAGINHAVVATDFIIGIDTTVDNVSVTLESAITAGAGRLLFIKDEGGALGTNAGLLLPQPGQTIDEFTGYVLNIPHETYMLYSDGANWHTLHAGRLRDLVLQSRFALTPGTQTVSAAGGVDPTSSVLRITGNAANVVVSATPSIAGGEWGGQLLYLFGTSDALTVALQDEEDLVGSGLEMDGGIPFILGNGDNIVFMWNSSNSKWYEVSRKNL